MIQLTGYHYHNADPDPHNQTLGFVNNTFIKNLEEGSVKLPDGRDGEMIDVPLSVLGISHPWVVDERPLYEVEIDPDAVEGTGPGGDRMPAACMGARWKASGDPVGRAPMKKRRSRNCSS